jgi:hypothetical protein
MSAGEEGNGLFDDTVGVDRVSAALKKLPFGDTELEEWEKLEEIKKQEWEAESRTAEADEVRSCELVCVCVDERARHAVRPCGSCSVCEDVLPSTLS